MSAVPNGQSGKRAVFAGVHSVRGALAAAHAGTRMPGSATACVIRLDRAHSKLFAANLVRCPRHARTATSEMSPCSGPIEFNLAQMIASADLSCVSAPPCIEMRSCQVPEYRCPAVQGDSGFLVARQGGIVFQTTPVQHFWDCPLQFAAHPDYASVSRLLASLVSPSCLCMDGMEICILVLLQASAEVLHCRLWCGKACSRGCQDTPSQTQQHQLAEAWGCCSAQPYQHSQHGSDHKRASGLSLRHACTLALPGQLPRSCRHITAGSSTWSCVQATDHASDATVVELEVNPGDVIVAGTDGLWDNLPVDEVLALLPQDADQAGQVRAVSRLVSGAGAASFCGM